MSEYTAQELWSKICGECESRLSSQTISTWLSPSRAVSLLEDCLTVELKNKFSAYYVEQNYQEVLDETAGRVVDKPFRINFVFPEGKEQIDLWEMEAAPGEAGRQKDAARAGKGRGNGTQKAENPSVHVIAGTFNPKYTFDDFVVGKNNQFSHAAALSVAQSPATRHNPLFIYGGVGLGKTHLMQAIGHHLLANNRQKHMKLCYISAEEFLNELIAAITSGSTVAFRNKYRQVDVLLIDDVEFLSRKEGTQEEFFHTFNTIYENQKQIVLTSDRPPREIHHLEERLRSRFQWGLVADIQPPEYETRMAILRKKSAKQKVLIPENVLEFIAESVTGNVRVLEGSLHYLRHYSDIHKTVITLDLAETVLKNIFEHSTRHIGVDDILKAVSDTYGMPVSAILSSKRKKSFVEPRQVAMYLCNKLTKLSLPETAEQFKRKDHTTVMHACRKIARACEEDGEFKSKVENIADRLRNRDLSMSG